MPDITGSCWRRPGGRRFACLCRRASFHLPFRQPYGLVQLGLQHLSGGQSIGHSATLISPVRLQQLDLLTVLLAAQDEPDGRLLSRPALICPAISGTVPSSPCRRHRSCPASTQWPSAGAGCGCRRAGPGRSRSPSPLWSCASAGRLMRSQCQSSSRNLSSSQRMVASRSLSR